jgi:hypothetical protein
MMSKFKKMYREWFGLKEAAAPLPTPDEIANLNANIEQAAGAAERLKAALTTEGELDEAQLVNNITDYQGGVQYILRDPAQAQQVAEDIKQWTAKKGFTTIKHTKSKTGKMGYFYFRLGQDPGTEAQKIQGYFSQLPELKHFRFNVVNQQPQLPAKRPQGKI